MTLSDHFHSRTDHSSLAFHAGCSACRDLRLQGTLLPDRLLSRRATAGVVALAFAGVPAAGPASALAGDEVTQLDGTDSDLQDIPDGNAPAPEAPTDEQAAGDVGDTGVAQDEEGADADTGGNDASEPLDPSDPALESPAGGPAPVPESVESEPAAPTPTAPQEPAGPPEPAAPPEQAAAHKPERAASDTPSAKKAPAEQPAVGGGFQTPTLAAPKGARSEAPGASAPRSAAASPAAQPRSIAPQPAPAPTGADAAQGAASPDQATGTRSAAPDGPTYTVHAGDSLWSIARDVLGQNASPAQIAKQVQQLWELNSAAIRTGDPSVLPVGVTLRLR